MWKNDIQQTNRRNEDKGNINMLTIPIQVSLSYQEPVDLQTTDSRLAAKYLLDVVRVFS
jgi:hypothetical protein